MHLQERKKGTVTAARAQASAVSVQPFMNPLWDIPYGHNVHGIFGSTPPELLHQWGLGIEKYAFTYIWDLIEKNAKEANKRPTSTIAKLDQRIATFNNRHSDATMPRKKFPIGAYKLPYLQATEYRALMYIVSAYINDYNCSYTLMVRLCKRCINDYRISLTLMARLYKNYMALTAAYVPFTTAFGLHRYRGHHLR